MEQLNVQQRDSWVYKVKYTDKKYDACKVQQTIEKENRDRDLTDSILDDWYFRITGMPCYLQAGFVYFIICICVRFQQVCLTHLKQMRVRVMTSVRPSSHAPKPSHLHFLLHCKCNIVYTLHCDPI